MTQPRLFGRQPPPRQKVNAVTRTLTRDEVVDPVTFAQYCQQVLGTAPLSLKELRALQKVLKDFFAANPKVDYALLARLVDWCRSRKRRVPTAKAVPAQLKYAWSQGHFPELDPQHAQDEDVERAITRILDTEENPEWRHRLIASVGVDTRREVLRAWRRAHQ